MAEPLIRTQGLTKKFGPFTALNGIDLEVYKGEVLALLGDNGAGKSTLIKILSGVHQPTAGKIFVEGAEMKFASPRDASNAGIGTVYQDLAINPLMSVTRNFFMGRELYRGVAPFGLLDMTKMDEIAHAEMVKIGIDVSDPRQAVGTMSGGQRQTLAIARAIYFGAKVLILDEPTSALGQKQQMGVLKTMMRVRARGDIAIIFITHNEIHSQLVADRYTFLALGEVIGGGAKADLEHDEIRRLMAGGSDIGDLAKELQDIQAE
ncbi:ATP-binding cassette domain-containing protein [Pacificibacter marinus]|jgi:simple sugar transport system ATP-binding protein|uniref:Ribose import ATP-binding protein RbsA n=1 Tax=Pacificibacter marinus TaxID=658057 RepID=A0A1Y5TDF3_9RHOB|nr:ATP-binding cassette domain-containing protein [Pacificibacter marinus]SEL09980.1 monosaccharide ABC transporter ATP-binding protein, CUT2 family [Pacificibacter marinus]SLN59495.1 Ribose import ATP-binding protein RbsA [Pacificibacter marinus]